MSRVARIHRLRRQGLGSVRVRSAVAAALVVALAMAIGASVFLYLYNAQLHHGVDISVASRAQSVAAQLAGGSTQSSVRGGVAEQTIVQVLDTRQHVLAASDAIQGEPAQVLLRPAPGQLLSRDVSLQAADAQPFHVVALGVRLGSGPVTVVVGQSLQPVVAGLATARAMLLLGCPILALIVAAATFVIVGRSLRPVEDIRDRVQRISATDTGARVPVPATDDEIARLARTMNDMLQRLQVASSAQRRLVADASHELRSPVTTLGVGLELLAARSGPMERSAIAVLAGECSRLDRLISGLLLLARADEQGLRVCRRDVDLDDLLQAERRRLVEQHPHLTVHSTTTAVRVQADEDQLSQLIRNLTDNAARYAQSVVSLSASVLGDTVLVEVTDDGPGVPETSREKILDRFVRLDPGRSRTDGGTGLGLAIVDAVARAHGGSISVHAGPAGHGALFRVRLPRHVMEQVPLP